jgi:hypothetical protein
MKRIFTLLSAVFISANIFAQAPQQMSYQTVIRDSNGALVANHVVGIQISILQGSPSGSAVYVETQTPSTNANGLASIAVGGGTVVSGNFASINWGAGPYFIETETDPCSVYRMLYMQLALVMAAAARVLPALQVIPALPALPGLRAQQVYPEAVAALPEQPGQPV